MPQRLLAIVMFSLAVVVCAAQDYGRIDTIWTNERGTPAYIRAHGDSIIVGSVDNDSVNEVVFSSNTGREWKSFPDDDVPRPSLPGTGVYAVTISYEKRGYLKVYRGSDLVTIDTIGMEGDAIPYRFESVHVHPLRPHTIFLKCKYAPTQLATFNPIYYRISDSSEWTPLKTPSSRYGQSRLVTLGFDYARPDRLWVTVNGSHFFDRYLPDENYYTEDLGETYHFVSDNDTLPPIIGALEDGYGVEYEYSMVRGRGRVTGLHLYNPETRDTIKIPWRERMVRDLLPGSETSTTFLSLYDPSSGSTGYDWEHTFNYQSRMYHAFSVTVESLIDGEWAPKYGVATTTDFGQTWMWLLRPYPPQLGGYLQCLTLDPVTKSYFAGVTPSSYSTKNIGSVLRIYPSVQSVPSPEIESKKLVRISPHPVRSNMSVSTADGATIDRITIHTLGGELVLTQTTEVQKANMSIDCSTVATGVYVLTIDTHKRSTSVPIIVQH